MLSRWWWGCEGDVGAVRNFEVVDIQPFHKETPWSEKLPLVQVAEASEALGARISDSPPRPRCFGENSKGADGAVGLLTALARCAELKDASSLSLQYHRRAFGGEGRHCHHKAGRSMPTEASKQETYMNPLPS